MAKTKAAVIGATGYAGAEIVRLLETHPCARVSTVTSSRHAGQALRSQCPWLASDLTLSEFDPETLDADIVFLCQESGFAMMHARRLLGKHRLIDLSADFRLKDLAEHRRAYKMEHAAPELKAVYGLPELADPREIESASLVANPGCYPTASLLALMPAIRSGLVSGTPVIDAKSGVSGAGRSKTDTGFLYGELEGGLSAYAVSGHRHTPEIEQMARIPVRFTPHLAPMTRGILATLHIPVTPGPDWEAAYREFYKGRAFVSIQSSPPSTKEVFGSNRCAISVCHETRTGYLVVCAAIDNLGKGAAGQAIQNMNLMLGLPEDTGLPLSGVWP